MIKRRLKALFLFFEVFLICFSVVSANAEDTKKIIIKNDYFSKNRMALKLPIKLPKDLIDRLHPDLIDASAFTYDDLPEHTKPEFDKKEHAFIITGDFNSDWYPDIAFIGKCKDPDSKFPKVFLTIFSIRGKTIQRDFFSLIRRNLAFFVLPDEKEKKKILVGYSFGSSDCEIFYWARQRYQYDLCDD